MPSLSADLRLAVRSLRGSPGFLFVSLLCLGLALGLNTTMFGVLDAALNPIVPYADPDRLHRVWIDDGPGPRQLSAFERTVDIREGTGFHEGVALAQGQRVTVEGEGDARTVAAAYVTPNFFALLGVAAERGRTFTEADGDERVAVVSERLWRQLSTGRRTPDGTRVTIEDEPYAVVGIAPRSMHYPSETEVWMPFPASMLRDRGAMGWGSHTIARTKPGVTVRMAEAELAVVADRYRRDFGSTAGRPPRFELRSLRPEPFRFENFHLAMTGAVVSVLLIACANISSLLLARGLARRRELAVRTALGASRSALVRQLLAECLVLAVAGAAIGAALAVWGMDALRLSVPTSVKWVGILEPQLSWRVFAWGLGASVVTVLAFGIAPAFRASRADASEAMKDGAGTTTGRAPGRFNLLVIGEIALSVVLLMGAGLLIRAAARVSTPPFNFDGSQLHTTVARVDRQAGPGKLATRRHADILERIRRLPTVAGAASRAYAVPDGWAISAAVPGRGVQETLIQSYAVVSPDYFRVLGLPLLEGSDFPSTALAGSQALVIIDSTIAKRYWRYGGAVGQMIKLGGHRSSRPWLRVVGVVRDPMRAMPGSDEPPHGNVFVLDARDSSRSREVIVRARRGVGARMAVDVRREIAAVIPSGARGAVRPYLDYYRDAMESQRFIAALFLTFAAFALLLASIGLYGVLSYSVGQRRREFGVRIALGARPADVMRLVIREALVMVLGGIGIGALFAMWSARLLGYWIRGIEPTDVTTLVASEIVLIVVALIACWVPAHRATRADPLEVLRAS